MQDFAGQVAIVTGGARGIGFAVASSLSARGARVCLVDMSADSLASASAKMDVAVPGHAGCMTAPIDVSDPKATQATIDAVNARWGRIDVLVQAAGITGKTNVMTQDVEVPNFDLVMSVNVKGIFLMCRAVLPTMLRQKYGRIVNIASIAGKEGNAGMLAYSTSKSAVIGLTKVIGKEVAETGVCCNALAPAVVRTEMVAAMPDAQVSTDCHPASARRVAALAALARLRLESAARVEAHARPGPAGQIHDGQDPHEAHRQPRGDLVYGVLHRLKAVLLHDRLHLRRHRWPGDVLSI